MKFIAKSSTFPLPLFRWILFFGSLAIMACAAMGIAHAAPLNFTTAETVSLASPATVLTIATGSVADALKATTSSVLATLSSSTGGTFTLLSPSYDLTVATSSGGGTAIISCSLGIESVIISETSGSTVYTITPAGTSCATAAPPVISNIAVSGITTNSAIVSWATNIAATTTIEYGTTSSYGSTSNDANLTTGDSLILSGLSANTTYHFAIIAFANGTSTTSTDNTLTTSAVTSGGGGGGSGGGGGGFYIPTTTPAPSSSVPSSGALGSGGSSTLLSLVSELRSLVIKLLVASNKGRPLTIGDRGTDVWALQVFLSIDGSGPTSAKLAAIGPTSYFGTLTQQALAEYQKSAGIKPASGYFGPLTRAYMYAHDGE